MSGRNLWIMRTRKACAPGTTTPKDDLDDESYCTASDEFASHSDSLDSELSNPSNEAGGESGLGRGRSHWRTQHSANGRRKNVCVSRSERGLLKRSELRLARTWS